jgi:hypothetical protein
MKNLCKALLFGLFCTGVSVAFSATAGSPVDYGLPARLGDLTDLQKTAKGGRITEIQATDTLLYWLAEERREPSPTAIGAGG